MRENEKFEGLPKVKRSGAFEETSTKGTNRILLRRTTERKEKQKLCRTGKIQTALFI